MIPAQLPDSLRILVNLRQLDEAGFVRLMVARRINSRGVNDLLDLAELLTDPQQVQLALSRLDWLTLRGLHTSDREALNAASQLQLATSEAEPKLYASAAARLQQMLPQLPDFTAAANTDRTGSEPAHRISTLAADAIDLLDAAPRTVRGGRGGVRMSGVEVRRIATELDIDAAVAGALYRWLFTADQIAPAGDTWLPTALGRGFAAKSLADRWRILALAWIGDLNAPALLELCELLGMPAPLHGVNDFDGAAPTTAAVNLPSNLAARQLAAEALGVLHRTNTDEGKPGEPVPGSFSLTSAGALLLNGEFDAAAALLAAAFPAEVDRVYIQPDRTIIAPGPLRPDVEVRLRQVADLSRRAIASEYRVDDASLSRALSSGLAEDQIREFLSEVSLTGIPQPIDYLIRDSAERFGRVRVRETATGTLVRAVDTAVADALLVDAALRPLGLRPVAAGLVSSVSAPAVLQTLLECRYPAVAEDENGRPLVAAQKPCAEPYVQAPTASVQSTAEALAQLAAESSTTDDHYTWLQRRLELARRSRQPLEVAVDIGGGKSRTLLLVPIAVGAQRLRALDLDADVERTLPLRSIAEVTDASD